MTRAWTAHPLRWVYAPSCELDRFRCFKRYADAADRPGGRGKLIYMEHPTVIRPADHADWRSDKMGKTTLFQSPRLLVGLNAFEPGQFHALHTHTGMDKVYQVVEGNGVFLLDGRELPMTAGDLLIAPDGVPHGVRNTGTGRLLLLAILAPAP